jgi:hypothetical protein
MKTILAAVGGVLIGAIATVTAQPALAQPQTASETTSCGVRAEVLKSAYSDSAAVGPGAGGADRANMGPHRGY